MMEIKIILLLSIKKNKETLVLLRQNRQVNLLMTNTVFPLVSVPDALKLLSATLTSN